MIHVRAPCLARSRTAEEPTGYGNVPDILYLVKGRQAIERSLAEVCRCNLGEKSSVASGEVRTEMPFTRDIVRSIVWQCNVYAVCLFDEAFGFYSRV